MTHVPKKGHNLFLCCCLNRFQTKYLEEWFLFQHGLHVSGEEAKRRPLADLLGQPGAGEGTQPDSQEADVLFGETLMMRMMILDGSCPFRCIKMY